MNSVAHQASGKTICGDYPPVPARRGHPLGRRVRNRRTDQSSNPRIRYGPRPGAPKAAPASSPMPVTTFSTPCGMPASTAIGENHCGARGFVSRLDHRTVARSDRRCRRAREKLHRVVPGKDVTGDAERLAPGVGMQIRRERNRMAVVGVDGVAVETEVAGRHRRIGAGLRQRFSGVLTFEGGEAVLTAFEGIGNSDQYACPVGGCGRAPCPRGRARRGDRAVDFVGTAACHRAE